MSEKYLTQNGISVNDTVRIDRHNSGRKYVGMTGTVTEIRDSTSSQAQGAKYVFEVAVGGSMVAAYEVTKLVPSDYAVTDDLSEALSQGAIDRTNAIIAAVHALPADLLTEDYLTAAEWIHDGTLRFTATLEGTLPDAAPENTEAQPPVPDNFVMTDDSRDQFEASFYGASGEEGDYIAVLTNTRHDSTHSVTVGLDAYQLRELIATATQALKASGLEV